MATELTCAFCGSTNISKHINAGWDIDEEGEEHQHLHTCRDCGAQIFEIDRYPFSGPVENYFGKWSKDGEYRDKVE